MCDKRPKFAPNPSPWPPGTRAPKKFLFIGVARGKIFLLLYFIIWHYYVFGLVCDKRPKFAPNPSPWPPGTRAPKKFLFIGVARGKIFLLLYFIIWHYYVFGLVCDKRPKFAPNPSPWPPGTRAPKKFLFIGVARGKKNTICIIIFHYLALLCFIMFLCCIALSGVRVGVTQTASGVNLNQNYRLYHSIPYHLPL